MPFSTFSLDIYCDNNRFVQRLFVLVNNVSAESLTIVCNTGLDIKKRSKHHIKEKYLITNKSNLVIQNI
jgi:hypothetical protein